MHGLEHAALKYSLWKCCWYTTERMRTKWWKKWTNHTCWPLLIKSDKSRAWIFNPLSVWHVNVLFSYWAKQLRSQLRTVSVLCWCALLQVRKWHVLGLGDSVHRLKYACESVNFHQARWNQKFILQTRAHCAVLLDLNTMQPLQSSSWIFDALLHPNPRRNCNIFLFSGVAGIKSF